MRLPCVHPFRKLTDTPTVAILMYSYLDLLVRHIARCGMKLELCILRAVRLSRAVFWRKRSVENSSNQVRIAKLCSNDERCGNC